MTLEGTLGFLGFGNMGAAIAGGLLEQGTATARQLAVYDVDQDKRNQAAKLGAVVYTDPSEFASKCNTILLAVKPQTMDEALESIKPGLSNSTLLVSIAAGISISYIQQRLGPAIRIVRVMPNTPALVNEGAAGIAIGANCTEDDARTARTIFESIGIAETVPETLIDAVTALSGSGPAYFFYVVESLVKAAVAHGIPEAQASRLAGQTLLGAGMLLRETGESPATLRERVTSKGGTTEAALNTFRAMELERVIGAGVSAAVERAVQLGK